MSKKILLADDSITIQKVVELTFSDGDYEVTAVNNGARAIQKLSEMRPDIILSDIIMPEKNGYEVCEFVKSHPEYRNIPVVLLTGTFEPFDPDRADKAGCDAVVTKPFESQSLIHKVEELIEASRANAPAPAPQAAAPAPPPPPAPAPASAPKEEPAPSPWAEEPPPSSAPAPGFRHADDIFGSAPAPSGATSEMPFTPPPSGGETRAIPAVGFEKAGPATTQQFTPPGQPEEDSPWGSPAPPAGETRAFPKMSFDDMKKIAEEKAPAADAFSEHNDESPFGAPPAAEQFSGETRAFPKMNFDDLQKLAAEPSPAPPAPEPPAAEESPWGAPPAMGETRAFPQMNFEQLSKAADESEKSSSPSPWDEPSEPAAPAWSSTAEPAPTPETDEPEAPSWATPAAAPVAAPVAASSSSNGVELTDDQVDRIARRVIQLMSDQVVRNIAWEVIPDMAEMVVKERIRQLESEG